jgi:hexosaminidase
VLVDPSHPSVRDDAETFAADAAGIAGHGLSVVRDTNAHRGDIQLTLDQGRSDLGAEGYALTVGDSVRITARTDAGAFYGTRTVLQLLRAGRTLPAGSVTDVPQYAERGVGVCACIINVSTAWLERLVKDAAYLKLNQLWMELKVKSTAHPESNEWGYYTRPQIAALQRLAKQYHVTLVPEVNSPGHIEPWIRNRPDLQLTDNTGQKQVSRLDITKPEAFDFLTAIIDEYYTVFDTPYWHMGADEYMLGSDYAKYPQILAYAQQKYGPNAVPEDAFVDFVNRVNAYVKSKGKTLRMWNDGITPRSTVPLDKDIVIEHWLGSGVRPAQLLAEGRKVENAAFSLYNVRGGFKMNTKNLYDTGWTPQRFEGQTVADRNGITGAKITMWPDNGSGNTENEIESEVRLPLRFIAQSTWGLPRPDPTYAAFTARADAAGWAPGFENVGRTPIPDGTYTLARDNQFLGADGTADGSPLEVSSAESAWDITATADGYYTLRDLSSGRCAETRLGTRFLNTPLELGTAITAQTCDPGNRLQRWQLTESHGSITLTNAITRMVALLDGTGLVQQVPDTHRAQEFRLVRAVRTTATVDKATVVPGDSAALSVTVANTSGQPLTSVAVRPVVPGGWTVTPGDATQPAIADGASWTATFTVSPPDGSPAGTASLGAVATYQSGGGHTMSTTTGVRVSCAATPTRPVAVTYVDSPATFWHTEWSQREPRPPHEIQLDLGAERSVCAITYVPRAAGNGWFGDYEFYLSTDGQNWGQPVAKGRFATTVETKWVPIPATTGRYLRAVELTEANGNPWATAAEISVDAR